MTETPLVKYLKSYGAKNGLDSNRKFADKAGIGSSTADALFRGRPPREETLESIADNTGLPLRRLRELANMPPEKSEPLVLGPESASLTPSQRRAVMYQVREYDKLNRLVNALRNDA